MKTESVLAGKRCRLQVEHKAHIWPYGADIVYFCGGRRWYIGGWQGVGRLYWKFETRRHRWSAAIRPMCAGNWVKWNRQETFTEIRLFRLVNLCHAQRNRHG